MKVIATITIMFVLLFIALSSVLALANIKFNANCGGHLQRAANANSVDTAVKELSTAIKYMEDNNLTKGYTSVIYYTPDEDIEFWYNNIVSARNTLQALPESSSELERSNALMKLRETLTDSQNGGTVLVKPNGIAMYPNNAIFGIPYIIIMVISLIGIIIIAIMSTNP